MAFTTRQSLLAKVRDGNEVSWREFYKTYTPLILLRGDDCGLTYDEKRELIQNVMCEIFQKDTLKKFNFDEVPEDLCFRYDPASKGRFRNYMRAIIRNQAIKIYKKRSDALSIDAPDMPECFSEDEFNARYEDEYRMHILTQAMVELRNEVEPDTFNAFEMHALQKRPIKEICSFLNKNPEAIYTAKSRCIKKLKEIIKNLEEL